MTDPNIEPKLAMSSVVECLQGKIPVNLRAGQRMGTFAA
jgi:hypothetical protein